MLVCRALSLHGMQIAPRTYWAYRSSAPSKRELWDAAVTEILGAVVLHPGCTGDYRLQPRRRPSHILPAANMAMEAASSPAPHRPGYRYYFS